MNNLGELLFRLIEMMMGALEWLGNLLVVIVMVGIFAWLYLVLVKRAEKTE